MDSIHYLFWKSRILFLLLQIWVKSEIDIDIETGEKSGQLVDKEKELLYKVKIEIDNAEEELLQDGKYVVFLQYTFQHSILFFLNT